MVDISGSMKTKMPDGKSRIDIAKNAIQTSYTQMIQRSLRQGKIHPRYRVAMVAYSANVFDVYNGIISIDRLKDEGIPPLSTQQGTSMARAFRYVVNIVRDDISKWSLNWLTNCPPPLIVYITDSEYYSDEEDELVKAVNALKSLSIPDGNVLVENIFITDQI